MYIDSRLQGNQMCLPETEETVASVLVRLRVITSSRHLFETLRPAPPLCPWLSEDGAFPKGFLVRSRWPSVHGTQTLSSLSRHRSTLAGHVLGCLLEEACGGGWNQEALDQKSWAFFGVWPEDWSWCPCR